MEGGGREETGAAKRDGERKRWKQREREGGEEGGGEGDKTRGALAQRAFRATGNPRRDPTVGCRRKKDVGESSRSGSKRKDA